jgi:transposase-like protein
MERFTIKDFQQMFPDEASCLEWLRDYRFPNGIHCKKCRVVTRHYRVASRPSYSCTVCGHHVHPTAGTIFHKSSTPLKTWFHAVFLMASTRCGISAKQIERETGVTYKTAWRMFRQIRSMLEEEVSPFSGEIEMDEAYIGGKDENKHAHKRGGMRGVKGKTPVIGAVQRGGKVVARVAKRVNSKVLGNFIREVCAPNASLLSTDDSPSYPRVSGVKRGIVNHSRGQYVNGPIHTNTIEGFWSLFKRGMRGVYSHAGATYLQSYLNEYSFRYNHRHDEQPMFTSFLNQIARA